MFEIGYRSIGHQGYLVTKRTDRQYHEQFVEREVEAIELLLKWSDTRAVEVKESFKGVV